MMWKGANFGVVDLGTNVPPEKFVVAASEHRASSICLFACSLTTMPAMSTTVEVVRAAGCVTMTKASVGGVRSPRNMPMQF